MLRIKKIATIIIFMLGTSSVAYAFYPPFNTKVNQLLKKTVGEKQAEQVSQATEDFKEEVLGETSGDNKTTQEELVKKIEEGTQKILSQEKVQEITKEVNTVIMEKVEETKDLPQQGVDKAKEEIRKEVYQQVCEEWLK